METFTVQKSFLATLDSKGRITIPAGIRKTFNLEKGDTIQLVLENCKVEKQKVSGIEEALQFIESFEQVESFSFNDETVEVVRSGK